MVLTILEAEVPPGQEGALMFRAAGVEPVLSVFDVASAIPRDAP